MAMTYDTAQSRDLDTVRRRIGDTGRYSTSTDGIQTVTGAVLTDEELTGFISAYGLKEGMAIAAESLAAFYNLEPNKLDQTNGISFSYGDRAKACLGIAAAIRAQGSEGRGSGRYGLGSTTISVSNDVQY